MMLANILQSLSGTINNIFLGQMIGVQALAAASAFFPLMLFLISFVMGLGSGASVLIGQAWGAKQPERVRAIAGTTLTVGVLGRPGRRAVRRQLRAPAAGEAAHAAGHHGRGHALLARAACTPCRASSPSC